MKKYTENAIQKNELAERLQMIEFRLGAIRTMIENRREGFHIAAQISSTFHALESIAKDVRCKYVHDCSGVEKLLWQMDDELSRIFI